MPSPKEDFEKLAPSLLQGNLWRKYLSRRKAKPEPLEQALKAFLTEILEVNNAFPEINSHLLATLTVRELAGKAQEKLKINIEKLKTINWYSRLATYINEVGQQVSKLEQTLTALSALGNTIATLKVGDTKTNELLLNYQDFSVHTLSNTPGYQNFVQQAKDEHYNLLLDFLKKAHEVETLFSDLVLVNKAFTKGSSASNIIKEETYLSQHLSNTAIILILSFSDTSIFDIVNQQQNSLLHPSLVLKKLSSDEWILLIQYNIGISFAQLAQTISQGNSITQEVLPKEAAIALSTSGYPLIAQAMLSHLAWLNVLSDDEFIKVSSSLQAPHIKILLSSGAKNLLCIRLANILNNKAKRIQFLSCGHNSFFTSFISFWLADAVILEALSDEAFCACLFHDKVTEFSYLFEHQPLFLKRLESFDSHVLVDIMEQHYKLWPGAIFEYLGQPTLFAKLDTNELLIRALVLLIGDANYINKLRKDNPNFDKQLTGSFLITLIQKEPCLSTALINNNELLSRFGINDIYILIINCDCDASIIKYFLDKKEILAKLEDQQLIKIQRSGAYIHAYGVKKDDGIIFIENDVIAAELERRQNSQPTVRGETKSSSYQATSLSDRRQNHAPPATLATNPEVFQQSLANKPFINTAKSNPLSGQKIIEGLLLGTLLLLAAGLIAATLLHASFILVIAINIALMVNTISLIGLYTVGIFNSAPNPQLITTSNSLIKAKDLSDHPALPKNHPHPATGTRHLGATLSQSTPLASVESYVAPSSTLQ